MHRRLWPLRSLRRSIVRAVAPDLWRLVRKTITRYDSSDDYEYYVETKSGTRHRIEQLFAVYDLDVMRMFERITDRFPWVQIHEELQQ